MKASNRAGLIAQLLWQSVKLGPLLQLRMFWAAAPWLLSVSKAGARGTIVAVDAQCQATVAAIAFTLTKLGFPGFVAAMTHEIVAANRADAVVLISVEGLSSGNMGELMEVNTAMLQQGHSHDAMTIAQAMATRGHGEVLKLLTEEGPLKSVTEPLRDAADWVMGHSNVSIGGLAIRGGDEARGDTKREETQDHEETNEREEANKHADRDNCEKNKEADYGAEVEGEKEEHAREGRTPASIS